MASLGEGKTTLENAFFGKGYILISFVNSVQLVNAPFFRVSNKIFNAPQGKIQLIILSSSYILSLHSLNKKNRNFSG